MATKGLARQSEPLNILVIDDEVDIRNLYARLLNSEQHQVVLVGSAEEGLQLLPHWTFHIAFVDQHLPGMEGLVLGEYLRRNNPDMSIVMMTGSDDPRIERRSRDLSLKFMAKPFAIGDVLGVIDDYLVTAREREARRRRSVDPAFDPPLGIFTDELARSFALPRVPDRIEDGLAQTIKRCLNNLTTAARYNERDRVMALSGLLTARVLGVNLPRAKSGITLFEEYDRLMLERGRRPEFHAT
ncbi:MAG TPA: response regulator [Polyangiaceae bacterium]|jgi:CheY-like chemotaxis protein|nr:response regulator [Polyangiaceae bacterium]